MSKNGKNKNGNNNNDQFNRNTRTGYDGGSPRAGKRSDSHSTKDGVDPRDITDVPKNAGMKDRCQSVKPMFGNRNDPIWYNRDKQLISDVAKISFNTQLGRKLDFGFPSLVSDDSVAGIIGLGMVPIPGIAKDATDGVNMAASNLFQYMRSQLSTVADYQAADMIAYILAVSNVYGMYSHLTRAFGIANTASATNLYYPRGLFKALYPTVDFDDFTQHFSDYRAQFNYLITQLGSLILPVDFTIVNRIVWLFANVWKDADSDKGQLYGHYPYYLYKFDETSSTEGSMLKHFTPGREGTLYGIPAMLKQLDEMIKAIRSSDSCLDIMADLKRAFKDRPVWSAAYVPENYTVLPTMSYDVLMQIENTTILPHPNAAAEQQSTWDMTQNVSKNILLFNPQWKSSTSTDTIYKAYGRKPILNFHIKDPSSDDVIEATRNVNVMVAGSAEGIYELLATGADICVSGSLVYKTNEGTENEEFTILDFNTFAGANTVQTLGLLSAFDWAPIIFSRATNAAPFSMFGDIENYVNIDTTLLNNMNRNVMTSMWSVPRFGSVVDR